jgi:hypothetical protein
MTFSGAKSQGANDPRDATPRFRRSWFSTLLGRVVPVIMPVTAVLMPRMRYRQAAFLAQLRVFGGHAFGYFRHVRNEIGTKPHRVGCACLPLLGSALSGGGVETDQQQTSRQRRPEDKTHTHIGKFPQVPSG